MITSCLAPWAHFPGTYFRALCAEGVFLSITGFRGLLFVLIACIFKDFQRLVLCCRKGSIGDSVGQWGLKILPCACISASDH